MNWLISFINFIAKNPKKRLIDGKDIHYYRREVMRKFKFYESI